MPESLISIAQARACVREATRLLGIERIAATEAVGRVLADELRASQALPRFASSAMDGYAVQAGPAGRRLELAGEASAGHPSPAAVKDGQGARISTGAALPPGADAVIRQEDTERDGRLVRTLASVAPGENVRRAGEVLQAGEPVLSAGTRIGPAELAAAVAAGAAELPVRARPRVEVICTGDELCEPGAPLAYGQIHNSNGPMLAAYATALGGLTTAPGPLPDDPHRLLDGLEAALERADLVLVSGGVSVGPHDHVKATLAQLGVREAFWGVSLQPGKPTWFGLRDRTLVLGLPGNPVSAAVAFSLFGAEALAALQGERPAEPCRARLAEPVRRRPREQALRVRVSSSDGRLSATPHGPLGSHAVTSLPGARALALIPPGDGEVPAGSLVALHWLPR